MHTITDFKIINHGWEHAQYFQGCGVSFTRFSECATGAGYTAKEAYEDALEQIASSIGEDPGLRKRPRGIRSRDKVPASHTKDENSEFYWYVSIRYNVKD